MCQLQNLVGVGSDAAMAGEEVPGFLWGGQQNSHHMHYDALDQSLRGVVLLIEAVGSLVGWVVWPERWSLRCSVEDGMPGLHHLPHHLGHPALWAPLRQVGLAAWHTATARACLGSSPKFPAGQRMGSTSGWRR